MNSAAPRKVLEAGRTAENAVLSLALAAMALLPLAEMALRSTLNAGIPGAASLTQHLTLVVGMMGAAIAAREGRLLAISGLQAALVHRAGQFARLLSGAVAAAVAGALCYAASQFVQSEHEAGRQLIHGLPVWVVQSFLPLGFGLITVRLWWRAGETTLSRLAAAILIAVLIVALLLMPLPRDAIVWIGIGVLALAIALGAPVFVALGGTALLLFWGAELPIASLSLDHYRLVVNPSLPAIPLFTLAGYFLAESKAPQRLVRVFDALLGGFRGGAAAVTVLTGAFFTAFTGASGITILALGGLLMPLLKGSGHSERSSLGLVTSSGSLGVLLPPSLPLILYAVVAKVPMHQMFLGAVLPGLTMAMLLLLWGRQTAAKGPRNAARFDWREAASAIGAAKWELALPLVAFAALFGGFATPVEAAALTALYAFVITVLVHRDLGVRRDVPRVMTECGLLVGGVLLILGVALGFTNYLVDAQVPDRTIEWATGTLHSRWAFLAGLNVFLLLVGCVMDIFSAIVVVVPIIVPVAAAFGVDPVHLGIVFLANMELGYLTPLVGMNVFFASYRFGKPVLEVCRAVLPFLAVLLVGVLIITYIPGLTSVLRHAQ
ncbi:MAG: C4-dicarboxylate ABC transporter permease [Proteobacteria bacterium]|nr:MAG: C4-dicarboxylate ABC transporter permease [Pseudomonadota bacterium]